MFTLIASLPEHETNQRTVAEACSRGRRPPLSELIRLSQLIKLDVPHRREVFLTSHLRFDSSSPSRLLASHSVSLTLSVSLFAFHYFLH